MRSKSQWKTDIGATVAELSRAGLGQGLQGEIGVDSMASASCTSKAENLEDRIWGREGLKGWRLNAALVAAELHIR